MFLHGWPQDATSWDAVLELAAVDGYAAYAPDLPGIGGSTIDRPTGDKHQLARMIHDLLDALGLSEVTLVGHDVGGMIAFSALRALPDLRAGVILDTVIPGVAPWDGVIRNPWLWHFAFHTIPELPERLVSAAPDAYFDYFFDTISAHSEAIGTSARARYAAAYADPAALHQGFEFYRALWGDAEQNRSAAPVSVPVLYLRGAEEGGDLSAYADGLREVGVRDVATSSVPDAGHFTPEENPEGTWQAINAFLAENTGTRIVPRLRGAAGPGPNTDEVMRLLRGE